MVRFDLGPFLQGQTRIAKVNSAYNALIIGPRVCNVKPNCWKSWTGNLLMCSDLSLGSSFKVKQRGHGGKVVTLSPPTSEAGV